MSSPASHLCTNSKEMMSIWQRRGKDWRCTRERDWAPAGSRAERKRVITEAGEASAAQLANHVPLHCDTTSKQRVVLHSWQSTCGGTPLLWVQRVLGFWVRNLSDVIHVNMPPFCDYFAGSFKRVSSKDRRSKADKVLGHFHLKDNKNIRTFSFHFTFVDIYNIGNIISTFSIF